MLNRKKEFWFRTNYEAKNFRIVKTKIDFEKMGRRYQNLEGKANWAQQSSLLGPKSQGSREDNESPLSYLGPIIECIPEDVNGGILESVNMSAGNVLVMITGRTFFIIF